ncbi:MAG: hypothetical protein IJH08_05660 [Atopobiaceae bacterium]|nr:hypothetical protein [Atopobiaceae bacterium]
MPWSVPPYWLSLGSNASRRPSPKRLIDITSATAKTTDALTKLDLPAGVDIEIKL